MFIHTYKITKKLLKYRFKQLFETSILSSCCILTLSHGLSEENSVFITIFNPFIQLGLKMSYFMPNILAKKKKHQFWVQKKLGIFFGGQNAKKMHFRAFLVILSPKNVRQIFFDSKFIHFLFS